MKTQPNKLVYLVDDDEDDRDIFADAFTKMDARVITFNSSTHLLEGLSANLMAPTHLFVDLNMPEMNGRELLKRIRGQEHLKHIPIIIYSTSTSDFDIDDTFELGANMYMEKPYSVAQLHRMLKHIFDRDLSLVHRDNFLVSAREPDGH